MFNSDPNNKDSLFEDIIEVGALTAGVPAYAYLNNKYQGSNLQETFRNYGSKLPGSDYLNNQMNKVISTTSGQVLSTAQQSLQKTFLSQLMMLEEMSPLHILRTLQLSNLVQPFTELSNNNEMIHISGRAVRNQEYYYRSLIDYVNKDNERKIKRSLQTNDLVRGMFYQNGKIYGATKEGLLNKDDLIMRDAKLVLSSVKNGEIYSANHILEKFANVIGSKINKEGSKIDPITIVAGKSSKDFGLNWGKSTLRFSMEVGFKTLDNPIAGIEEMLHGVGANYTGVFQSRAWQTAKRYTNINFGTGGRYDLGTRESLKISAKNVALKGAGLYLGYEVLDSAVRTLSGEGGLFDNGLASGLANIYASSRIAFAEVWSDRFQGYKEKQEQNAPGSTDLTKLLAFPLGGALLGAQLSYFSRVGVASVKGTDKAASIFNVESESKFLKNFGIDTKLKPMKKNALIGGLVGAAFTLPFLPGALIGSSSDELRDLYSGKTDVAEKSNRFWMMGGQCLPSYQPIYTRSGVKEAKDIIVGDELLDRHGNYNKVTRLFEREVNENIFNIKVSGAKHLDNKFTSNHPILTTEGWIEAKDIKKDDILVAPKFKVEDVYIYDLKDKIPLTVTKDDFIIPLQKKKGGGFVELEKHKYNRFINLSPQLGLIFGWFLAEGTVSQGSLTEFTFHSSELNFATVCAEYLKDTFGCNYTLQKRKGETFRLRISSSPISRFLKLFFYNSFEDSFKKFPDLSNTNEEFIKNFVIGLYYGDGDITSSRRDRDRGDNSRSKIRLTTSKLDHVLGLKNLLTFWDIYPYILKEVVKVSFPNGTSGNYITYRIVSEGLNSYKLFNVVGVYKELYNYSGKEPRPISNPNYWFDENNLYIKVTENTEEYYSGLVHDFTVENSHEFQVTSFIVHNSLEGGATKFFTKNWVARLNADATDKVRYGDDDTKKKLNPFLHPFSYLRDPYKFEKLNAESMPYPVWGLDVAYGGIFGKVFEKTIGQVIKPDVINPAIYDANQQQVTTVSEPSLLSRMLNARREGSEEVKEVGSSLISNLLEDEIKVNKNLSAKDQSLVMDGLFTQPAEARYQPIRESAGLTYKHLTDFTGIKGWSSSLMLGTIGLDPDPVSNQLARSGEAESSARDLVDQNVGDLLGLGEFQRKILPTSSGALADRINPIANNMVNWLPSDSGTYYKNFALGNPYDKVARGEERLPGVGYAALNPELEGVKPEDYSLVYKLKILTDVARGSKEHRDTREQAIQAYNEGDLSNREIEILGTTLDQEQQLQQKKDFYTRPYGNLKGPVGSFQSNLWESMRSNSESPLEMLTPIRPVAKFLHQRTAIEDYIETQLGGSDAAIWTNPYSHFIKPAVNKSRQSFDIGNKVFIPEETREKYNIEEYFDKFDYIRKRMQGADNYALSTVVGASLSGLNTKEKVLKFKSALSDDQKDYFDQFSKETNEKRRAMIRAMLPDDVRRGYEQIWQNVDIAQRAKGKGASVQQAIADNFHNQTEKLKDAYNVSLSKDEKTRAIAKVNSDKDTYANLGMSKSDRIKYAEDEALRLKMADREALTYVNNRTGLPSKGFIGWDPRLKTDDIKIKSLSIGGEDLRRFGFWKKDEERMRQLDAITEQSGQVFTQIDDIKRSIRSERAMKMGIERTMFDRGFKVTNINFVDSDHGSLLIKENSN